MKPAPFDYVKAGSIDEALEHLERAFGDASLLAGGQTLMPLLSLRMARPSVVIDINRIDALSGISLDTEAVSIGAMTRQNAAIASGDTSRVPGLVHAMRHIGHYQTRNRGTVGGSIALGEPAAELPAIVVALGAQLEARSTNGTRLIAADEFYLAPYATTLGMDEMLTAVRFPLWPSGSKGIFKEVARRPGDFALVGLVGAISVEEGRISQVGLAWFGMGPTPMKAIQAEQALHGQLVSDIDIEAVAELAIADTDPFEDKHASADYRRKVGAASVKKALAEAFAVGEPT